MFKTTKFALLLFFIAFSSTTLAEEFLEEVSADSKTAVEEAAEIPSKTNSKSSRYWSLRLGLGGSLNSFVGSVIAQYHYNEYVVPEIWANYATYRSDEYNLTSSSLETPLILYLANSSMFWPFIGAGPGYERWHRSDSIGTIDDTYSLTAFHLIGMEIKFSEFFSLVLQQKTGFYVNNSPVKEVINRGTPSEEVTHEEQIIKKFTFNFYISF